MHDRRLWTVTKGWDDFVRICFPPQYSRVDQAWRLKENNGNGIFRCLPGGNNFFCSIVTGMDSQQERKDISQREELSSFCEGVFLVG
jgi:hypothetical protein